MAGARQRHSSRPGVPNRRRVVKALRERVKRANVDTMLHDAAAETCPGCLRVPVEQRPPRPRPCSSSRTQYRFSALLSLARAGDVRVVRRRFAGSSRSLPEGKLGQVRHSPQRLSSNTLRLHPLSLSHTHTLLLPVLHCSLLRRTLSTPFCCFCTTARTRETALLDLVHACPCTPDPITSTPDHTPVQYTPSCFAHSQHPFQRTSSSTVRPA